MKTYDMTVRNIPCGLLTCIRTDIACGNEQVGSRELSIEACSPNHVVFRCAQKQDANCMEIQFAYFVLETGAYKTLSVSNPELVEIEETEVCFLYTYEIASKPYTDMMLFVIRQMERYITLRVNSAANEFSKQLVAYPAEKDELFADNGQQWKQTRLKDRKMQEFFQTIQSMQIELAIPLDNTNAYEDFLKQDWLSRQKISNINRVYIGNAYCHLLLPKREMLLQMIEKAWAQNLEITLVLPYARETMITEMEALLTSCYQYCRQQKRTMEVVINDYGELLMLQDKTQWLQISFGSLLNKRRKDPRYAYKPEFARNKEQMKDNAMQDSLFQTYLEKYQVTRIECETCGYEMRVSMEKEMGITLAVPMYQTNTSQYCPIYALCVHGDRKMQTLVTQCPHYCKDYVCLYPEHLSMIGKYTSIFALDEWLLQHPEMIECYQKQGVNRILWNL